MEEKERNDRLQEIQQRTQPSDQPHSSPSDSSELVSKRVGPFCLRRPTRGPPQNQEGNYHSIEDNSPYWYNAVLIALLNSKNESIILKLC